MGADWVPALRKAARHAAPVFADEGWLLAGCDNNPPDALDLFCFLLRLADGVTEDTVAISSGRFSIREGEFGGLKVSLDLAYVDTDEEPLTDIQGDEGWCCRDECCGGGSWCCSHADKDHACSGDDELPGMWSHSDFTGGQEVT